MPRKQNKWTHDTVLLCRTVEAEKKVRVNDHEDTLCEPKVVGCLSKKIIEMMGAADRVADGMEQSWITAHVFQLTCLLTFRAQLVEKPDCTFQCVRDRIRGLDSHQSLL